MKRVLIVDDEFLVRMGLKMTLDWKSCGYEIAGEASSAEEALEIMEHEPIDILMTDIKMQDMDGLDLIEQVNEKYPNVQSVILTNYSDFNYARRAMDMGANKYILKSEVSPDSLLDSLVHLSGEQEDRYAKGISIRKLEEKYLEEQLLKLNISSIQKIVLDQPHSGRMFAEGSYVVMVGHCSIDSLPEGSAGMLEEMLVNLVSRFFTQSITQYVTLKNLLCFGVIHHDEKDEYPKELMVERCAAVIKNTLQYFQVDITVGISSAGTREDFPRLFEEAEAARLRGFFHHGSVWIYDPSFVPRGGEAIRVSSGKLKEMMEAKDQTLVVGYIDGIFQRLQEMGDYLMVTEAFIDLLAASKPLIETYDTNDVPGLNPAKFDYHNLYAVSHIDQVKMYVMDVYMEIWNFLHNRRNSYSAPIRECICFIEDHYARNITLDHAAEAVNVSSSYLSFIFKQETGINFSSYLTDFRIEMSKKLILKSNLKIYEIAEQVGFGSPYYFSKVFKEMVGMTCKEFKNRYGAGFRPSTDL